MTEIRTKTLDEFRVYLKTRGRVIRDEKGVEVGRGELLPSSCNTHIRHLKIALKTAMKWKYIKKQDIDLREDLRQYKVDKSKPVYMNKAEVKKLLGIAAADPVMKAPVALQVYTGMSRAEIMAPMKSKTITLNIKG